MMEWLSAVIAVLSVVLLPAIMLWGLLRTEKHHLRSGVPNGDITELVQKLAMLSQKSQSTI